MGISLRQHRLPFSLWEGSLGCSFPVRFISQEPQQMLQPWLKQKPAGACLGLHEAHLYETALGRAAENPGETPQKEGHGERSRNASI